MKITVRDAPDGKTVYAVLRENGLSGTLIKLCKSRPHGITAAGNDVTVRTVVRTGDVIIIDDSDTFDDENEYVFPSEDKVDILYEDDNVFVINKPAGMPTHTSHGHHLDTLANALCAEYKRRGMPFVFRPVNRLDADTSGALMAAKGKASANSMAKQLARGLIKKTYIAVLDGEMDAEIGKLSTVRSYIRRRSDTIILRESSDDSESGDYAETDFMPLYIGGGITVVRAMPKTGRTHQLRVHFSSLGHPITGDELYGGKRELISRQALHAYSLAFETENGAVTVTSPLPDDMRSIVEGKIHL